MYHFVHIDTHTGAGAAKVFENIHPPYLSACHNVLRDTIRDLQPKVVVVCGYDSIAALPSCHDLKPFFPIKRPDLKKELLRQEQKPFYVGQIAGRQITLFISYHWSTRPADLVGKEDGLEKTWHSIGQSAQAGNA
jgi:hypothetical protein